MWHSTPVDPAIRVRRARYAYADRPVIRDLDLTVPRGSIFGFLGPNGAGKTTTIKLILGLLRVQEGEINVLGSSIAHRREHILRRVGTLIESPSVYPHLTGRENLEVARRLRGCASSGIDRALTAVSLDGAAHRLVREYSLGMRQRLGIALALLDEPELLILDEPTNGLDPEGIVEIRQLLAALNREAGITIFISSHLLAEIEQVATHLAVIHHGRCLFQGTHADLKTAASPYLEIEADRPQEAVALLAAHGCRAEMEDSRIRIEGADRERAAILNRLLVENGHDVFGVQPHTASLEDLFLSLVHSEEGL